MLNNDEHRIHFTTQHDSQKQCSSGGAQCGVVSKKKADVVDHPFPNKAVIHRRAPRTQAPPGLDDFGKMCISTQQRSNFLPKKYNSDVTRTTTELRKSSQRMPDGELEKDGAVHAILQDKLGNVEKKIRETTQRGSGDTKIGDVFKSIIERQYSKESKQEKAQKFKKSHYVDIVETNWQDNFTRSRNEEYPRTEDQIRNTYEVQQARWEVSKQGMISIPNKPRLQNANEALRGKTRAEKHYKMCKEIDENYSEQNQTSLSNMTWTTEKKYKEMPHKNPNDSGDKQNIHQKILHKPVHGTATENQRGEERKVSTESAPPLVSNSSQGSLEQQQAEVTGGLMADDSFQSLPCKICNRMFRSERLETHTQICRKLKKYRPVYNISAYRRKGLI